MLFIEFEGKIASVNNNCSSAVPYTYNYKTIV